MANATIWWYNTPRYMIIEALQKLGFAKNEARIYEALLEGSELPVGEISKRTGIHRRNVYDSLERLIEKGFVFEVFAGKENIYKPVDPQKLTEIVSEQRLSLEKIFPKLSSMYKQTSKKEEVYVFKGLEGWRLYLRDVLEVGKDVYTIGGKGSYFDPKIQTNISWFLKEFKERELKFQIIFDPEVKDNDFDLSVFKNLNHKFFPEGYSSTSLVETYGDRVVSFSGLEVGKINENSAITVIVNQEIADAYRTWYKYLWGSLN